MNSAKSIQKFCSKKLVNSIQNKNKNAKEYLGRLFRDHIIFKQIKPFFKCFFVTEFIHQANKKINAIIFKHLIKFGIILFLQIKNKSLSLKLETGGIVI